MLSEVESHSKNWEQMNTTVVHHVYSFCSKPSLRAILIFVHLGFEESHRVPRGSFLSNDYGVQDAGSSMWPTNYVTETWSLCELSLPSIAQVPLVDGVSNIREESTGPVRFQRSSVFRNGGCVVDCQ